MADIPVIFSAPMIRALLEGRKTMTRRLAWQKPQVIFVIDGKPDPVLVPTLWQNVKPGAKVWVKERHWRHGRWIRYKQHAKKRWRFQPSGDGPDTYGFGDTPPGRALARRAHGVPTWCLRPSIFMPRAGSRLTLTVTATKIERLQDISRDDVLAEGISARDGQPIANVWAGWHEPFAALWDSLHGPGAWENNPEVVALTFTVARRNIDAMEAA